jgi:hypothetical protein
MGVAKGRRDRSLPLLRVEQRLEATVAVALKDAGEGGQLLLGALAAPVT